MAKSIIQVATPDQRWEQEHRARCEQREFTESANEAFQKSDTIMRPRQTAEGERLPPITNRRLRVGCFEKQK